MSSTRSITTVRQTFYNAPSSPITLEHVPLVSLTAESISDLTTSLGGGKRLGVAASYGDKCFPVALAFSTTTRILLITLDVASRSAKRQKQILKNGILCDGSLEKHGFFMERLAAALYLDLGLCIQNAFDITSGRDNRGSLAAYKNVLRGAGFGGPLKESVVERTFSEKPFTLSQKNDFALRAWACNIAVKALPDIQGAIDTSVKDPKELRWMCRCARDVDRLDSLKPRSTVNDVSEEINILSGAVGIQSTRYKTRVRQSTNQHIRLNTEEGEEITGRVGEIHGRAVVVTTRTPLAATTKITSVVTIGKDDPTRAETSRVSLILDAFKGGDMLLAAPFIRKIFFPDYPFGKLKWPVLPKTHPGINFTYRQLNKSQRTAVEKCLSNKEEDRHVVIIGPPGTGKTTVIAAVVQNKIAEHPSNTIWIIAQSNVAVKNVAEKLAECGFLDFKLLVSTDFHFDWHEHLYEAIRPNVIESGDFGPDIQLNGNLVLGSRVILCTISMLAADRVFDCGFTHLVPVQTVIVDEASQIEVGEYLPMLAKYKISLRKMVFIGDDKQLAPYGQEEIPELRSVFEWPHLVENAVFLDTQYRMPTVIGDFISRQVYDSKLLTMHAIRHDTCCRFVHVSNGEEAKRGVSWMNEGEVRAAVIIARRYTDEGKKFKIITPYDAQRNEIENALKTVKLPWENTVFNVDSFQGNEEDHIIISVVRTSQPGFMKNQRRTNVMLSRCKKSMMILTHQDFLRYWDVAKTLVGQLAKVHIPKADWITLEELVYHRW